MEATCKSVRIYDQTESRTEDTPYGPLTADYKTVVMEQHWTNYPGKTPEFTCYSINVYRNGCLIHGHITPTRPAFIDGSSSD